jgi:N utilization substance protein B
VRIRRRARIVAIQTLYELDLTSHPLAAVIEQRIQDRELPPQGISFARHLVEGVLRFKEHLDSMIQRYAPEWPIEQMAPIDRNILRMALFEFSVDGQTPVKVAINEAVELAKLFGSDSAPRFINGVLGSLAGEDLPVPASGTQAAQTSHLPGKPLPKGPAHTPAPPSGAARRRGAGEGDVGGPPAGAVPKK